MFLHAPWTKLSYHLVEYKTILRGNRRILAFLSTFPDCTEWCSNHFIYIMKTKRILTAAGTCFSVRRDLTGLPHCRDINLQLMQFNFLGSCWSFLLPSNTERAAHSLKETRRMKAGATGLCSDNSRMTCSHHTIDFYTGYTEHEILLRYVNKLNHILYWRQHICQTTDDFGS